MSRSYSWVFTINNYEESHITTLESPKFLSIVTYMVYGREVAPTTGTPHIQGYVRFKNQKKLSELVKKLPKTNFLPAKGSPEQNFIYCSKENAYKEFGTRPKGTGKRTDLDKARQLHLDNVPLYEGLLQMSSMQGVRYFQTLNGAKPNTALIEDKKVYWFYGTTGTGKSWTARQLAEAQFGPGKYWISTGHLKFWNGYNGEECVILDDFRADFCPYSLLLRYLDIYPSRVEVKGAHVNLLAKVIYITCPFHPEQCFATVAENKKQLLRRITEIREFSEPYKAPTCNALLQEKVISTPSSPPNLPQDQSWLESFSEDSDSSISTGF